MSNIKNSIDELIGNTPLLRLKNIENKHNINSELIAKIEYFNPGGSVKDRVAKNMLDNAEKKGILNSDTVIIEPTSGNTGIGLAAVSASRGYKTIIVMPSSMSEERKILMKAYGAELVLTEGSEGMTGAIKKAEELHKIYPNSFIAGQFDNPANPEAHYLTTGPEIWGDTDGQIDYFVCGVGTGGTITGIGKYLKEKNKNVKIIGVEPENSAVLSGGKPGPHGLQGIGAGFIPKVLDINVIDEVFTVSDNEAYTLCKEIAASEGILVGISSGAALCASLKLCSKYDLRNKRIVVLLPDTGDRYLSTSMFR